jgi:hypothetical protein
MTEAARQRAIQTAMWRTASPHEWEWTEADQANMALYVLWATQRLDQIEKLAKGEPITFQDV